MKICVGLSGGVDSSVAALLLKEQGYDVFALFMQNWHDTTGTLHGDCEWEEDLNVAKMVAKKIGIPFHFVDLSTQYRHQVVDYMFSEYEKGRTPNPDVMCNSKIKFDAFLEAAQSLGADYVATGHYCRKETVINEDGSETYRILAGTDPNKDQSYFLCGLSQKQLSKAIFPIGDMLKPEVRQLAKKGDLPSALKKDSQGICFVGKVDLPVFLQQQLKTKEGNVVEISPSFYDTLSGYPGYKIASAIPSGTLDGSHLVNAKQMSGCSSIDDALKMLSSEYPYRESDGNVVGRHIGAHYYTIGQRKGLNIGGHKDHLFIIHTDIPNNTIYVGEGQNHPGLLRIALRISNDEIHWIRDDMKMKVGESRDYRVRIRYRQPLQNATLYQCTDSLFIVFEQYQRGITPGQFAVWYTQDLEMIGSGVISSAASSATV